MPIIKVDRGITKTQIKKVVLLTSVVAIIMSLFIMRVRIEQTLADKLTNYETLPSVATTLYTWAANGGSLYAQSRLGEVLRKDSSSKEEKITGESWLLIASENGDLKSMYDLAYDTIIGKTYTAAIDNARALEFMKTAINSGYTPEKSRDKTNYVLAYGYLNEAKKEQNDKQVMVNNAKEYGEKAYLNKEAGAAVILAEIYSSYFLAGWSDEQRLLKAIQYRKEMVKEGHHENGNIAMLYYNLNRINPKQEYLDGVSEFAKKAISDPQDKSSSYFKAK